MEIAQHYAFCLPCSANIDVVATSSPYLQVFGLRRLIKDGKHSIAHARCVFGEMVIGLSDEDIDRHWVTKLQKEKAHLNTWSGEEIQKRMVCDAKRVGLTHGNGCPIEKFNDIGKSWTQDGSLANQDKLWEVLFGSYDNDKDWSEVLEKSYMSKFQLVYDVPASSRNKGCIQQIIASNKAQRVKLVNKCAKRTHKMVMRLSKTKEEISSGRKLKRRKPGVVKYASITPILQADKDDSSTDLEAVEPQSLLFEESEDENSVRVSVVDDTVSRL